MSAVFAIVLLSGVSFWWCEGFSKDADVDDADIVNASKLCGSLVSFLVTERQRELHPSILIAGSSINGMGIYRALLEERLGPTGKVALSSSGIWECERILKKFPKATENVKVVYLDLQRICSNLKIVDGQKGNTFRILHDFSDVRDVQLYESLRKDGIIHERLEEEEFSMFSKIYPYRKSFRKLKGNLSKDKLNDNIKPKKSYDNCQEGHWTDANFIEKCKIIQEELTLYTADATYEPQDTKVQSQITHQTCKQYAHEIEAWICDFVKYCEGRGIFVVFNSTPRWRTFPQLPDSDDPNLTIDQKKFLTLVKKLNAHPNCRVIVLKDFQTLIPDAVDAEYLFDTVHMTKNGATVYTHWLADQTLRDEKICAHLGIKCQADAQTDFPKLIAELGLTVPNNETQFSETRVAEKDTIVK